MVLNLRNIGGWVLGSILIILGFVRRALRRAESGDFILSVCFHNPSKPEFEKCIRWLQRENMHFLHLSEVEDILLHGAQFPKKAVVITVDDGWQSNVGNVVGVANECQVPVAIFVSTSPVEEGNYWWTYVEEAGRRNIPSPGVQALKHVPNQVRLAKVAEIRSKVTLERSAMTVEQVKEVAASDYVTIGAHTHTHPILLKCSDAVLYKELQVSKRLLESWTGEEVSYFAYPNGDYGQRELNALGELDYKLAFTTEPIPLTSEALKKKFQLPRYSYLEGASFAENICRITGVWQPLMRSFKSKKKITEANQAAPSPFLSEQEPMISLSD